MKTKAKKEKRREKNLIHKRPAERQARSDHWLGCKSIDRMESERSLCLIRPLDQIENKHAGRA